MRIVLLAAAVTAAAWCQVAGPANAGYRTPEGRAQVAAMLSAADRDARQRPQELVSGLRIQAGMTVVDLGTGVGYMLPYLSHAVGPAGIVVAEDIQTDFLGKARAKAEQEGLENVRFLLGTDRDPKLFPDSADLIMVLDAYHHFDYPGQMLAHLSRALHAGGRLAIIEYYKRRGAMGGPNSDLALTHIRLDADDLVKEVEANGFRLLSRHDHVPGSQYVALFAKK
jgi:ubiquinone/menaquinone biosynthesis C-methylase UbiE